MPLQPDITLAVLAGGEGSRMGRPKGLLEIAGRPILEHLLNGFAWPGPTLLVTAPGREHPPGWARFEREAADPVAGLGPLRGVLTALEQATTDVVVVATVDMPGVAREHVAFVAAQLTRNAERLGLMLRRGEGADDVEPFPSAFRAAAAATIAERLRAGRRSMNGLMHDPRFGTVLAPRDWGDDVWTNLNNPDDLAAFHAGARARAAQEGSRS